MSDGRERRQGSVYGQRNTQPWWRTHTTQRFCAVQNVSLFSNSEEQRGLRAENKDQKTDLQATSADVEPKKSSALRQY